MGYDLYMEQQNWRPRKSKIRWLKSGNILIERDVFYVGYKEFYRGPVTKEIKQILKGLNIKLPPKP